MSFSFPNSLKFVMHSSLLLDAIKGKEQEPSCAIINYIKKFGVLGKLLKSFSIDSDLNVFSMFIKYYDLRVSATVHFPVEFQHFNIVKLAYYQFVYCFWFSVHFLRFFVYLLYKYSLKLIIVRIAQIIRVNFFCIAST